MDNCFWKALCKAGIRLIWKQNEPVTASVLFSNINPPATLFDFWREKDQTKDKTFIYIESIKAYKTLMCKNVYNLSVPSFFRFTGEMPQWFELFLTRCYTVVVSI